MVNLDSNKIEVPISALVKFTEDAPGVVKGTKHMGGELIEDRYIVSSIVPGFSYFELNNKKQSIIFSTSAKILGDDYFKGINVNTIERVIDTINKAGESFLQIDPYECIEYGRFLSIDTTSNLVMSDDPKKYLDAMNIHRVNDRYRVDYSTEKDNLGIVFNGRQKSFKERLIMYSKFIELQKPDNRLFLQTVSNPTRLLNSFKNVLRVEQNSVQLRKIRERLRVPDTSIQSVLCSPVNPNYNMVLKIVKGATQLSLFDDLSSFDSFHRFEKYKGQQTIIRECGYDVELIEQVMRHFFSDKTNISRQKREYRELAELMLKKESIQKANQGNGLVDEVLELLKAG